MRLLPEADINCPYCGEAITVLIDWTVDEQQYVEDCQVCCQPMDIRVRISASGATQVEARRENDA